MSEIKRDGTPFIGYEYREIEMQGERTSMYLDCYPCFGWVIDDRAGGDAKKVSMKRDRKIVNRVELTRLQRHFEACMEELAALERSKTSSALAAALFIGLIGTVFMACATFAAVHDPPIWWLMGVLSVPGFVGWILPYFVYQLIAAKRSKVVAELAEQKYDEIYEICQQGSRLL